MIGFFGNPKRYKFQEDGWDYPEPIPQKFCVVHPGIPVVPMMGKIQTCYFAVNAERQ
jgi:hypothetical protein